MTVRYHDAARGQSNVRLVALWKRGDLTEMDMGSSGPKDQIRNGVYAIFEREPHVQCVAILSTAAGAPFTVVQAYNRVWFDRSGQPVIINPEPGERREEIIG